jgi:hypothetical protein
MSSKETNTNQYRHAQKQNFRQKELENNAQNENSDLGTFKIETKYFFNILSQIISIFLVMSLFLSVPLVSLCSTCQREKV